MLARCPQFKVAPTFDTHRTVTTKHVLLDAGGQELHMTFNAKCLCPTVQLQSLFQYLCLPRKSFCNPPIVERMDNFQLFLDAVKQHCKALAEKAGCSRGLLVAMRAPHFKGKTRSTVACFVRSGSSGRDPAGPGAKDGGSSGCFSTSPGKLNGLHHFEGFQFH